VTTQIFIPKLGWEMEEGTLLEWLVADGNAVEMGAPLYVLETDKVETQVDAPVSGVLRIIGVTGETYAVGALIAEIA
jgi:pyruvate/2-oxoglutarate dehydrogenase complex dihydrolipoamide acyltransferase (E2) component